MKKIFSFVCLLMIVGLYNCSSTKQASTTAPKNAPIIEERILDEVVVSAPKDTTKTKAMDYKPKVYNASAKREFDLLHTKIDIKFDWAKQYAYSKATLTMRPYAYPMSILTLDAKNFTFNAITLEGSNQPLKYDYDGEQVKIQLGKTFKNTDEFKIFIDYVAKPNERKTKGSEAITSDKGLFFINPLGEDKSKPMQIWTQGETESNSAWFPTFDKPNERCTQETYITVEDKYKTLSNGVLVSSTKNSDGTRTDYWKMDKPHAPYLFMMTVGDFAVVKDKWGDMDLMYYVEPKYEADAKAIFPYTPEMLTFFSEKTGVKYPWQKFAQVIVRDYVSGAMENTSSVIFGDFMQKTRRELIDTHINEELVAHEMFHQWFGDLVTCESWSNLTLNEGFATYSEYLWFEHKHGKDLADQHLEEGLQQYLGQGNKHDLIYFDYTDREATFDGHSYQKGGHILHLLRNYVGDEVFFTALKQYLTKNAYSDVEAHELRLAFEDASGEDLNWFFNQWYYSTGHPELLVTKNFDDVNKKLTLTVEQTQDGETFPAIFQLPLAVDIYSSNGTKIRKNIRINERKQTFTFDLSEKPALVNVDADRVLLGTMEYKKSNDEYIFQYYNAPNYGDRIEAVRAAVEMDSPEAKKLLKDALNDKFFSIRAEALQAAQAEDPATLDKVKNLVEKDPNSNIRALAMQVLASTGNPEFGDLAVKALAKEEAMPAILSALQMLYAVDKDKALNEAKKLENQNLPGMVGILGELYSEDGSLSNLGFFEKNIGQIDGFDAAGFLSSYAKIAKNASGTDLTNSLTFLKNIALDSDKMTIWKRYGATRALNELKKAFKAANKNDLVSEIGSIISQIKSKEKDKQLMSVYETF